MLDRPKNYVKPNIDLELQWLCQIKVKINELGYKV